ncbi:hypothetical protein ACFYZ8_05675 [Streptomyces sp. NPDC001668]|uniref:hypothetical protein n=1 Tax=unclassified Streptomyces TaxID=2593676 RepID=UPI0036B8C8CA
MRYDNDLVQEETTRLTVRELASQGVVLVADATWDAKSATDSVGSGQRLDRLLTYSKSGTDDDTPA